MNCSLLQLSPPEVCSKTWKQLKTLVFNKFQNTLSPHFLGRKGIFGGLQCLRKTVFTPAEFLGALLRLFAAGNPQPRQVFNHTAFLKKNNQQFLMDLGQACLAH